MKVIGIIAEYNPFHNGHLYQINEVKKRYPDCMIIVVLSGPFTQRGEPSIISKYQKAKLCLMHHVDLVIELPYFYATQAADYFADAAIEILNYLKIDALVFGTETEDINDLIEVATSNQQNNQQLKMMLKTGMSYAAAVGKSNLNNISTPNNLLAISYIKAINKFNPNIEIINIKRTNNYHDKSITGTIASATSIRSHKDEPSLIKNTLPRASLKMMQKNTVNNKLLFDLLKYKITTTNIASIKDVEEGIENRVYQVINKSSNIDQLITAIKSKRYTYARISRMLNHILLNVENNHYHIDYIRVLGFNKTGKTHLNKIKKELSIPIITCYKPRISPLLDLNLRADLIYNLLTNNTTDEYKVTPIIKK